MEEANDEQNIKIEQLKKENENILNNINNLKDKGAGSVDIFKCTKCDFKTHSEQGLKTHTKRKHADNAKSCEFCGKTLDKSVDMKKHMQTHTTKKEFKLKCDHCEYVGNSRVALDVHIGNGHSDTNKCGLCEHSFENNQKLNVHLSTCEIYICRKCQSREPTVSKIKDHVQIEHDSENYIMIDHWKTNRDDHTEVTRSDFYFKFD